MRISRERETERTSCGYGMKETEKEKQGDRATNR